MSSLLRKNIILSFVLLSFFASNTYASGYFNYDLDLSKSEMLFSIELQGLKTAVDGKFDAYKADVSFGIDTPLDLWDENYSAWIEWKDDGKGTWRKEVYGENRLALRLDLESMKFSEEQQRQTFLSPDQFDSEKFPQITLDTVELVKTVDGKGLIGKLKIKDVEKIVYIPVVLEKQEGGAAVSGRLLIDLLDYNFVPRKQYIPEEGLVKLPFTLSFKLVFNSVPSC